MIYKIPKEDLKRLADHDRPIPEDCEKTVKALLELDADIFWATCTAVIVRMTKTNKIRLKDIIIEMLEGFPKELAEWKKIEVQFDEYFAEMDDAVSLTGFLATEETDE